MLFRVWCENNREWETDNCSIDVYGRILNGWTTVKPETHKVEFNTGITLADGTETFYGDIIRYDDSNYHGQKDRDGYVYKVLTKNFQLNEIDYMINIDKEYFYDNVELVGNIHETELTDVMKVWIK